MIEIWTEKYRPKSLTEVIGQEKIVSRLKAFVKTKSVPHCLFAGSAGIGKTTCALALAKDLYGEHWKQNFLETNASDERGINVVRSKIKDFARTAPLNAPFKIIFLDESDALTSEAQQALRRTMEKYSNTCRFILSCNYSSKVLEPIQSRTAVFRFNRLTDDDVHKYIMRIAQAEGFTLTPDGLNAVTKISYGDLRKATNVLQAASIVTEEISEKTIFDVSASLRPKEVKAILTDALSGKFLSARNKLNTLMIDRGLDGLDIIKAIHREVYSLEIPEKQKLKFIELLGEYEFRITEGGTPDIQIEALLAQLTCLSKT